MNSDQLLTIECGIHARIMKCVLDKDASTSIIADKVVKKLGILPRYTNLLITIADGSTVKPLGITEHLEVQLDGSIIKHEFLVIAFNHEILLGLDCSEEEKMFN